MSGHARSCNLCYEWQLSPHNSLAFVVAESPRANTPAYCHVQALLELELAIWPSHRGWQVAEPSTACEQHLRAAPGTCAMWACFTHTSLHSAAARGVRGMKGIGLYSQTWTCCISLAADHGILSMSALNTQLSHGCHSEAPPPLCKSLK